MRLERVLIGGFGPFRDRELELAPGLTVVHGANETGKSTWLAALWAALCGLRRGAGATNEGRDFAARHRPWAGGPWQVSVRLELAGGRRVEISRDLDHRTGSARDLALGGEVGAEIMNEGTPDGSRWLGLDRRSFLATACVRQAQVLEVLESAGALQVHLERAAASGGGDQTAAAALRRLEDFERDQVGREVANSVRPLRMARKRVEQAEAGLAAARAGHDRYLEAAERAGRLEAEADAAGCHRDRWRAALLHRRAARAGRDLARARELAARRSEAGSLPPPEAEDGLSKQVAAALAGVHGLPAPAPALNGSSAADLERELAGVPGHPEGDCEVAPRVAEAFAGWRAADQALKDHDRRRPAPPESPAPLPPADALRELAGELKRLDGAPAARSRSGVRGGPALAAAAALAGVVLAALGASARPPAVPAAAWLAAAAVLLAAAAALVFARRSPQGGGRSAAGRRARAQEQARAWGLPADPARLRELAERVEAARWQGERVAGWQRDREWSARRWREAAAALGAALAERGATIGGDPLHDYRLYEAGCRERAGQARAAARREDLGQRLRERRALEAGAERDRRRREEVGAELRRVAERCGVRGTDEAALVAALRGWEGRRDEVRERSRRQREAGLREGAELASLLSEGSLGDLESRVGRLAAEAGRAAGPFPPGELAGLELGDHPDARLAELADAAQRAAAQAAAARREVDIRGAGLAAVAAAEEEQAAARAELRRVEALADTLRTTRRFLEAAERRAHREIAPVLTGKLEAWLPRVTGRHREAIVSPQTLQVQLRSNDGQWREAGLLSQGTREQVYLLLRLALVEHLGDPAEPSPIILDDVTVQSDAGRTGALLELLHEVSRERQVILFSQEDGVREWAERRLSPSRDRLVRLVAAD